LRKPAGEWCKHCDHHSCKIYPHRPAECRAFKCGWLAWPGLADRYRPDRIGLLVASLGPDIPILQIIVEPERPTAWKEGLGAKLVAHLREQGFELIVVTP